MGEVFLQKLLDGRARVVSAGSNPSGYVHPVAIEVMKEKGYDLSAYRSKHLDEYMGEGVCSIITVCGNAEQACPVFEEDPKHFHWGFDDPADAVGTEDEVRGEFRRIRDEIEKVFGERQGLLLEESCGC